MLRATTVRSLGRRALWLVVLLAGWWALLRPAVHIFGDHVQDLWTYQSRDAHRFTAMSMLTGSLKYHYSLVSLVGDEQVYDGAGYTNWGYGVPLLQLPFHAVARHMRSLPSGFFPDRAIFFAYLALTAAILWAGLDRLLALVERRPGASPLRRHVLSWAAAAYILCWGVYPSIAAHLHVYDETIVYLVFTELVAMSAYVFLLGSRGWAPVVALAAAAGLGLLTRPTGAIFLAMWAVLVVLERPCKRAAIVFLGSVAPFVVFWMVTNWVRTGHPWSLGFQNGLPGADHVGQQRFGSLCVDNWDHTMRAARAIFDALFILVPERQPFLKDCQFTFEPHTWVDPATEPYLGTGVLLFLVWTLLHNVLRRRRTLASCLPHAAFALTFVLYVYAGVGVAWRYVGDFLPLVFVAAVQYVRSLPLVASSVLLGWPLAAVLLTGAYSSYEHHVEPTKKEIENIDAARIALMREEFESTRSGQDKILPSKVHCGSPPDWPHFNVPWRKNVAGWEPDCGVRTVTEIFLGVPPKQDDSYVVRFETSGMSSASADLYVNGRMYTAYKTAGDTYQGAVHIPYASLSSPSVLVSIEWQHRTGPVAGKLMDVSIQ